jgi:hypothetical protein
VWGIRLDHYLMHDPEEGRERGMRRERRGRDKRRRK